MGLPLLDLGNESVGIEIVRELQVGVDGRFFPLLFAHVQTSFSMRAALVCLPAILTFDPGSGWQFNSVVAG
jgi:hypothetical protein